MKIGIVCYPSVGGSGIVATELGHSLAERGHQVHFITYEIPFRLDHDHPNIHFHQVDINQYHLFKYPDYALTLAVKMAAVVKEHKLDILHVHYAIPHATSAYLAKQLLGEASPAIVTTLHGTDITLVGRDPAYFEIVKFSIEQSDGVTAVSQALRKQTCDYFHLPNGIEVIHNFFTPRSDLIDTKPLRDDFVKDGEKLILHSSNYRSVKRPQDVIAIFTKIRQHIRCKLLLMGSGEKIEEIRQTVDQRGLHEDVIFIGENRLIDSYVASSDLFLLPSEQESFGLAALEALAYGVPVIASNTGGLPELIDHGKTGFLAPVGDTEKMAEYAVTLLQDSSLHAQFSHEAQNQAKEKFHPDRIIPKYEAFYEHMLCKM